MAGVQRLVVVGTKARYEIEPARYSLGLSRVGMVDRHLGLLPAPRSQHPDVDRLLDARLRYMRGPAPAPVLKAAA